MGAHHSHATAPSGPTGRGGRAVRALSITAYDAVLDKVRPYPGIPCDRLQAADGAFLSVFLDYRKLTRALTRPEGRYFARLHEAGSSKGRRKKVLQRAIVWAVNGGMEARQRAVEGLELLQGLEMGPVVPVEAKTGSVAGQALVRVRCFHGDKVVNEAIQTGTLPVLAFPGVGAPATVAVEQYAGHKDPGAPLYPRDMGPLLRGLGGLLMWVLGLQRRGLGHGNLHPDAFAAVVEDVGEGEGPGVTVFQFQLVEFSHVEEYSAAWSAVQAAKPNSEFVTPGLQALRVLQMLRKRRPSADPSPYAAELMAPLTTDDSSPPGVTAGQLAAVWDRLGEATFGYRRLGDSLLVLAAERGLNVRETCRSREGAGERFPDTRTGYRCAPCIQDALRVWDDVVAVWLLASFTRFALQADETAAAAAVATYMDHFGASATCVHLLLTFHNAALALMGDAARHISNAIYLLAYGLATGAEVGHMLSTVDRDGLTEEVTEWVNRATEASPPHACTTLTLEALEESRLEAADTKLYNELAAIAKQRRREKRAAARSGVEAYDDW